MTNATEDDRKEFWDRLDDIRTGMLGVNGRYVPMTHNLEPEDGNIWFLTAKGTDMGQAALAGAESQYIVCGDSKSIYADIAGRLEVSHNPEKLDEVWSAMASTWFEGGKDDPDLLLIRIVPKDAEVWLGPESGLEFLWKVAKAKVSGEEPDYGKHFTLTF